MRPSRTVLFTVPLALLAAAAPAGAAGSTPKILPGVGMRTTEFRVADHGRSVGLTRALARSLPRRGARVGLTCADVPSDFGGASTSVGTGTTARRGVHLQIPRGFDFCVAEVVVKAKTRRSQSTSTVATASVALNAAGEDYLHERDLAGLMAGATSVAFTGIPSHRHPTAAQVAEVIDGTMVLGKAVSAVALAGPDVQVPAGTIGVWLDGTRTSTTATTPGGRHLYFDYDRSTRGVSSNVLTALNDTTGADLPGGD